MPNQTQPSPKDPANESSRDVVQLPSFGGASNDSFELLLQKMRTCHDDEIRRLSLEVESLRSQIAESCCEPPADLDPPAEQIGLGGSPESGASSASTPRSSRSQDVEKRASTSRPLSGFPARWRNSSLSASSDASGSRGLGGSLHRQQLMQEYLKQKDILFRLVHNPAFDMAFAVVIALFGLVLAFEAQFIGFDVALATGHASASKSSESLWPDGKAVLTTLQNVFGFIFLFEMVLKMGGLRLAFAYDVWNWIDLVVNSLWVYSLLDITPLPINPQMVRISRLSRLLRLLRLVQFMKGQSFDALFLMTTAVKGSASVLAWTLVLLVVIHLMLSILLNQILHETYFNIKDPGIAAGQVKVYEYFGTFFRAFLTMFEITLANWPPACRVLIENVSEWFILYAILHKMVLGFAVIGVVNGVFIQETFKVATLDDAVMVRQTVRKQAAHKEKMKRLFEEADLDSNGVIDVGEWQRICEDDWVKHWLASQELSTGDAQSMFMLLDDGKGVLAIEDLIKGASRLRGAAATIEMLKKIDAIIIKLAHIVPEGSAKHGNQTQRLAKS